jgi:hypothetical protein
MRSVSGVRGASRIGIGRSLAGPAATAPGRPDREPGRDLLSVAPPGPAREPSDLSRRPCAGFLAHLIATAEQLPQTRERRRAEPAVAIAAYRTAAAAPAASPRLSRSS